MVPISDRVWISTLVWLGRRRETLAGRDNGKQGRARPSCERPVEVKDRVISPPEELARLFRQLHVRRYSMGGVRVNRYKRNHALVA